MSPTVKLASVPVSSAALPSVVTLAVALALAMIPAPAAAHPEPVATLVNRYVTVYLREGRLDLQYTLLYGELTAPELRRQIDGDGNGQLDDSEVARHRRAFAGRANALVRVRLDGQPLPTRNVAMVDLNGQPVVAPVALVLELTGWAPLPPGDHRLEVEVGPDLPRMGDTEIVLEAGDAWSLLASEQGPAAGPGAAPQSRFQLSHGHGEGQTPRAVTFVIRSGAQGPGGRPSLALVLVLGLGALVALAALALALLRNARRRVAPPAHPGPDEPAPPRPK